MPYNIAPDGAEHLLQGLGSGQPVVFSHGWPLNADAWDVQLHLVAEHGYRAIAHDRRGHGRSTQTWDGNDMDTYADDLAELIEALDLQDAILVGHSTGGGEVARYVGRHGTGRVAKVVLVGAVPPLMLKTDGQPRADADRGVRRDPRRRAADRSQFYQDLRAVLRLQPARADGLAGRAGPFWRLGMQVGLKARLRLRQGVLRDRLHRGPQGARRPDADRPRRRRPDRPDRRRRPEVGRTGRRAAPQGLIPARRTASPVRTSRRSMRTCWSSSRADAPREALRRGSVVVERPPYVVDELGASAKSSRLSSCKTGTAKRSGFVRTRPRETLTTAPRRPWRAGHPPGTR